MAQIWRGVTGAGVSREELGAELEVLSDASPPILSRQGESGGGIFVLGTLHLPSTNERLNYELYSKTLVLQRQP